MAKNGTWLEQIQNYILLPFFP